MAPIQVPFEASLKALTDVTRRRNHAHEASKNIVVPTAEDIRQMAVVFNKAQKIQEVDADTTKANLYYIRLKFMRYV